MKKTRFNPSCLISHRLSILNCLALSLGFVTIWLMPATSNAVPPTAVSKATNVTTAGGTSYHFVVSYNDDLALDFTTIDSNDVRITGPGGFNVGAALVSVVANPDDPNQTGLLATYSIVPPGGSWDAADNGTYTVVMQANQVLDGGQEPVEPGPIGTFTVTASASAHPPFFNGEAPLSNGVFYLAFSGNGNVFGYYSYLSDPRFLYHFDMGYEYWFDAQDSARGIYFYDFTSKSFFYTSPSFPFPYLYDFSLNAFLYYFPDSNNPGRYTQNPRYFYNFATGGIITK